MPSPSNNHVRPHADELSQRALVSYRLLLALGGGVIVLLGFLNSRVDPTFVDPWLERIGVAAMCFGALALTFWYRRSDFVSLLYLIGYVITAWIVKLLALNGFHYHFGVGLMVAVPAISTVFRTRQNLLWYCLATVAMVGVGAYAAPTVEIPLLTYLTQLATLCALCFITLGARLTTQAELEQSEERYAIAAAGANDGLWDWDLITGRVYFARRWKEMLGYQDHEIESAPEEWFARVHPHDLARLQGEIEAHQHGNDTHFEIEHRMRHRDGSYRWMLARGMGVVAEDGRVSRMAGSQTDVSARKAAEEQLLHDAFHDALTGLPNRALFMERLARLMRRVHPRDFHFAVFFVDLDRFKIVNESLGHVVGNELLCVVAQRLLRGLRNEDTLARLGGDEFALLFTDAEEFGGAVRAAERVQEELARPIEIAGREIFVSASLGIALSSTGYERPEDVLRDAEAAMYRAKAGGKGRYEVFDKAMHARSLALLTIENDLRRGIERGEFHAYFQPIVRLDDGQLSGFEALVRWHHPERGLVSPGWFIGLAEETGLIIPLGKRVLREACRQARGWNAHRRDGPLITVSVNLSGRQLAEPELLQDIDEVLEQEKLQPEALKLEVTESILLEDPTAAGRVLESLRSRGIGISLDDFGTGYSSLSYLHRLPVDTIKVDRSFVGSMHTESDGFGAQVVQTVVLLARNLSMETIAEGVETYEQRDELRRMGCTLGQGMLFSAAMDAEAARALLAYAGVSGLTAEAATLAFVPTDPTPPSLR